MDANFAELIRVGREALEGIASSASAVRAQLLASRFYEAVRAELERGLAADRGQPELLAAALDACQAIARPSANIGQIAARLEAAVAVLEQSRAPNPRPQAGPPSPRPMLRVINGGLSRPTEGT